MPLTRLKDISSIFARRTLTAAASLALAAGLVVGASSADAKKITNLKVGNWNGGAYTNNNTGAFSHCAASAKYKSGLLLLFSVTKSRKWSMGFSKPEWNFRRGNRYPVKYQVDSGPVLNGTAIAKSNKLVQVFLPANDRLFSIFRGGDLLKVKAAKEVFKFRLTDTSPMLQSLLRCAVRHSKKSSDPFASGSSSNSDPFSSSSSSSDPFSND